MNDLAHFLAVILVIALLIYLAALALKFLGAPPEIIRAAWVVVLAVIVIAIILNLPVLLHALHW